MAESLDIFNYLLARVEFSVQSEISNPNKYSSY